MKSLFVIFMLVASTLATAAPAPVRFDRTRVISLEGVVRGFQSSTPHAGLLIDVSDADGQVTTWKFEFESESEEAGILEHAWMRHNDLATGTRVTIKGNPAQDGSPVADWIELIRNSDGRVFSPPQGTPVE